MNNIGFYEALAGLLSIESVAVSGDAEHPFGEGPAKALDYMLSLCDSFGFRTGRCGRFMGWAEIGEGEEMVGVLAHLDVVPAGSGWDYPAFGCTRLTVDGEKRVYGRGITDDKGPAMLAVYAMKALLDSGQKLNRRIRILFGLTEERGEWVDMEYYKKHEELPTFGFTPDASFPAVYGEKGILVMELVMDNPGCEAVLGGTAHNMVPDAASITVGPKTFTAEGKSAHGSTPCKGENAILRVMKKAVDSGVSCPLAEFIGTCFDEACDGAKCGCAMKDEESGELTLNFGMVWMENEKAHMIIDIRYPVTKSGEDVLAAMKTAAEPWGITVSADEHKAPVYMDKNGPVIRTLMEAYREETGDETEPFTMGGGTYARAMPGIVAFGPLFPTSAETEHQKNEYMTEADLECAGRIYKKALEKLASL